MFTVYTTDRGGALRRELDAGEPIPDGVIWIDMLHPTLDEERAVEAFLGIDVPSREDMAEIEVSSRLYQEDGNIFLTAPILAHTETDEPQAAPTSFILAGRRLITVRYAEPSSFQAFATRAQRAHSGYVSGETSLVGLLETIVDRSADILERVGGEIDLLSRAVFESSGEARPRGREFHDVLSSIARKGDLVSKARESLVSIGRLLIFLGQAVGARRSDKDLRARLETASRDVNSLTDHASYLSSKITFLLEATLGMINIEQNAIIKIFSIAAVVFLPPTLIASIYGMNYEHMPELTWPFGYPLALGLMVASAAAPLWYFKRRGWL